MAAAGTTGGASVGTISLNLAVNGANLGSQITQAVNQQAAGAITSGGMAIANIIGNLATQAITKIASQAKEAIIKGIDVASDLVETQNVVNVAFDDMAYKAEEFAKTAIDSFGISELSAKKASSTFMAMGRGMGIASEQASDMAINISKLAADAASFYNKDYDTMTTKLKAVYTGETEGLKDLGIAMTQTNLKAFALKEGINKDISAMSQAELVALRYKFVMEQLSLAQGDFKRSEDSWANMTKKLSQAWDAFLGKIGSGMIEILTPFLNLLTDVVDKLNEFADAMGWGKMEEDAEESGKKIGDAMTEGVNDAVEETKDAMMGLLGMDEIQKLTDNTSSETDNDLSGWEVGGYGNEEENEKDRKKEESNVQKFVNNLKKIWKSFEEWISPMVERISKIATDAFDTYKMIGEDLFNIMKTFWENSGEDIKNIIERIVSVVSKLYEEFFKMINKLWNSGGKEVFEAMAGILSEVFSILSDIWTFIGPILEKIIEEIMPVLTDKLSIFAKVLSGVLRIIQAILEAVHAIVTLDFNKMSQAGESFKTGINSLGEAGFDLAKGTTLGKMTGMNNYNLSDVIGGQAFADGGIVSKPTLGLVGEYSGASSNPEAIAPISDLKEIMIAALRESGYSDDREITIPLTVNLGTKTIVSETVKAINRETKRRNKEVIVSTK